MRTITQSIDLYTFDELSDAAKDRATKALADEHFWQSDSIASLEAFADQFGATVTEWQYAPFGNANIETDATPAHFRGFTLEQARALPEYPTGYWLDAYLREAFIKQFETTGNAFAAFMNAMNAGIRSMRADWEAQYERNYMIEHCEANGYEFTEGGVMS